MSGPQKRGLVAETRNLAISYHTRTAIMRAVQDASIEVGYGETVAIVGESGSGKSTVARSLLGLLNEGSARITGGQIFLESSNVTALSPRAWEGMRGHPAAIVFQDPLTYLNPVMTIGAQILESIRLHDRETPKIQRLRELLALVRLPHQLTQSYPDELSGGMRQRVLLAIALGCRPKLLVADEPTTALDVTTQADIMRLLRSMQKRTGMAMLLISHDLNLVASICKRIYVMYAGRTIEWGVSSEIFEAAAHPYTRGLLAAAEGKRQADGSFVTIQGEPPDLGLVAPGCPFQPRCSERRTECETMPEPTEIGSSGHMVRCFAVQNGRVPPAGSA